MAYTDQQYEAWWQKVRPLINSAENVEVLSDYAFIVKLDEKTKNSFHHLAVQMISNSLSRHCTDLEIPSNTDELFSMLSGVKNMPIWEYQLAPSKLALAIEQLYFNSFQHINLIKQIYGWQFPVDLRLVHGDAPPGYLSKPYPTDHLHCDFFGGEPFDIVNTIMFVGGDLSNNRVRLYDPVKFTDEMYQESGTYKAMAPVLEAARNQPIEYEAKPGELLVFDGHCPHGTVRSGGVRVCFQNRFRRVDPYTVIDKNWAKPQTGWTRFWYPANGDFENFDDRIQHEQEKIRQHYSDINERYERIKLRTELPSFLR